MKHLGFASIAALKQYLRYADARKLNTAPILQKLGLTQNIEQLDEGRITGEQFQAFLDQLIHLAQDPTLGLSSALYVQTHSYSLLGTIAERSETLGEAIERIPLFERLVGDMGTTQIERSSSSISLTWHCNYTNPNVVPHMIDNVLASWTLYARWLTNSHSRAQQVYMKRPEPKADVNAQYHHVFECPIHFGQARNSIALHSKHLDLGLRSRQHEKNLVIEDRALEGKARTELSRLHLEGEAFDEQVLRSIRAHLQLGIASKELIAQEFSMSERNLQRHLAHTGTSYRALIDTARKERALNFLSQTQLSTTEIAHNLGYQDERCFFRSFKRWVNQTPHQYRQKLCSI